MPFEALTYCTNIHPAESLNEVRRAITEEVVAVKTQVSPRQPFNVGLRLSARAAAELAAPSNLENFVELLRQNDLFVTTLNGFPYGAFHDQPVKQQVYRPDWREPERGRYTTQLAEVLAQLLPAEGQGSISTVPGCFKPRLIDGAVEKMVVQLLSVAQTLVAIRRRTGKCITLCLEPEPFCLLETTEEAVRFFKEQLWSTNTVRRFAEATGQHPAAAEASLRTHLGVCLDACHAAIEFEEPTDAFQAFEREGIAIGKVQVSAGLKLVAPDASALEALRRFDEAVYLHQVVIRDNDIHGNNALRRYLDLGEALRAEPAAQDVEWRVHFHVPVCSAQLGSFESTQEELASLLTYLAARPCPQLEVETYTWGVLPPELRTRPLSEAIAEELRWTRSFFTAGRDLVEEGA